MDLELVGKVVVVIGVSKGIGMVVVCEFVVEGVCVIVGVCIVVFFEGFDGIVFFVVDFIDFEGLVWLIGYVVE